jgi:predicted RNase H-like HicB family nuclease
MTLIYPACFYKDDNSESYAVEVPDLPGCVSGGASLVEALMMGTDAASGWVLTELEDGMTAPRASAPEDIQPDAGGFVSLLVLDMDAYIEKYGNKDVMRNVTIPAWLDTFAAANHIDYSRVLRDSLAELYQKRNAV